MRPAAVPRDSVVNLAARLGAERVVIGSVVGTPGHMILRASVVAVPSAQVRRGSHGGRPRGQYFRSDRRARGEALGVSGRRGRAARQLHHGVVARTASISGRASSLPTRATMPRRSVGTKGARPRSRFALAALHLAMAAERQNDDSQVHHGIALAWTSRDALSERDLALLVALAGPEFPLPSSAGEQVAAWRRPVDLAPNDAESWYTLGARIFHDGALAGLPGTDSTRQRFPHPRALD